MHRLRFVALSGALGLAVVCALTACGNGSSSASTAGDGGSGDGKYHPPGNGTHEAEAEACSRLSAARDHDTSALGCSATAPLCPDLIRIQSGAMCLEYDEGTVQGCVDYYDKQTTCDALLKAVDACVVTSFPGTNGC